MAENGYRPEVLEEDRYREECGVVAIMTYSDGADLAQQTWGSLSSLQHRGQEAAGIALAGAGEIIIRAEQGLVTEVFPDQGRLLDEKMPGARIALGQVRYGTSGSTCQPILGSRSEIALAHNGEIVNIFDVALANGHIPKRGDSDSEIVTQLVDIATKKNGGDILAAVKEIMPQLEGGYAIVATDGKRVVGVRDPNGLRPLFQGRRKDGDGFMMDSEDVAIWENGGIPEREVEAGEIVIFDDNGVSFDRIDRKAVDLPCIFEAMYFQRPESTIRGRSVYNMRRAMGDELAKEELADGEPVKADIVMGAPESGIPAAMGYAEARGIKYVPALTRNPYYTRGRTFIHPTQQEREDGVRQKIRVNRALVEDLDVIVHDDSMVRGTTVRVIAQMLRDAGAKSVHIRISSPPAEWPCFYGVDMGRKKGELIAIGQTTEKIAKLVGADSVRYLSKEGIARASGLSIGKMCMACLNGEYPTPVPVPTPHRSLAPIAIGGIFVPAT